MYMQRDVTNGNAAAANHGSPLEIAAGKRDLEVASLLLAKGANINAKEGYYGTALISSQG